MKELSRKHWIDACQFSDLGQRTILEEVAHRVRNEPKIPNRRPTVVFDLDSTLYEVAARTHAIIKEWLTTGHKLPKSVLEPLNNLKHEEVGYSLRDTFLSVGLDMQDREVHDAWVALKDFWWERFFSSAYLMHDQPYPGAAEFVRQVHQLGAHIVYLTGRDEKKMLRGTIENLYRDKFPLEPATVRLMMKQNEALTDSDYKRAAAVHLEQNALVIASFENEPHNVVALFESFPKALHIFMETICSDKPARALSGLYRIKGFQTPGKV